MFVGVEHRCGARGRAPSLIGAISQCLPVHFLEPLGDGFRVFAGIERGNSKEAFSLSAESCAWGNHHLDIVQNLVEDGPASVPGRSFDPYVWRVDTTVDGQAGLLKGSGQQVGVA